MNKFLYDELLNDEMIAETGRKAPDFTLYNQDGKKWNLHQQRGKVIALLFYPQNETLVCRRQMCSVRERWREYIETKAIVVGICRDSVDNHLKFSSKHKLPLPILADETGEITSIYSQHWIMPVSLTRTIVIIDANGIIRARRVMLRAIRPADSSIICAIHAARADELANNYETLTEKNRYRESYTM